ncbi:TPR_REGION domain-containing protein [Trichonephila clavipes]|nr:TPR_REGION domain-containing protein [Trichonephila clavipes]
MENRCSMALEHILKSLNLCSFTETACAQLHADHGDILKDLKQYDDASQSYRLAIQLDPKLSHAHVNLAVINHLQSVQYGIDVLPTAYLPKLSQYLYKERYNIPLNAILHLYE